jgi:hypothetical protein
MAVHFGENTKFFCAGLALACAPEREGGEG